MAMVMQQKIRIVHPALYELDRLNSLWSQMEKGERRKKDM